MRLDKQLKQAITASGLTHYRIGLMSSTSPTVLDRFMAGMRDIRLATASRIADALGLELAEVPKQNSIGE
jgi:hypothetical protein